MHGETVKSVNFMFMGPCIFIYEDHINNQRDASRWLFI